MKKTFLLVFVIVSFLIIPIHSVTAQENTPIIITKPFEVSAVKNSNTDQNKDYTVTVKGIIKNNSNETISNIKIYLDVSTAFLGLKDTLVITINGDILPNQTYSINLTEDLSEKFAKVDKVYATVGGGERFDLAGGSSSSNGSDNFFNFEYETPSVWFSVTLLAIFAGLFVIAILSNKSKQF